MGETLAETRVEVLAQRYEVEQTAAQLRERARRAIDIRAKIRENPLLFGGLAAGGIFLAVGGPMRLLRAARRRIAPTRTEQAYDALPAGMQRWVDVLAEGVGPKGAEARRLLAEELERWRHEPTSRRQARRLAREAAEGPPGPGRAAWKAVEAAATLISAALARRAIERFLSGDRPLDAAAELSPAHAAGTGPDAAPGPGPRRSRDADAGGYAGWSGRQDGAAGGGESASGGGTASGGAGR